MGSDSLNGERIDGLKKNHGSKLMIPADI